MNGIIYLDESGDLGWIFNAPFRQGGSSRHLTITGVCVPTEKSHIPKRVVKRLYDRFGWPTSVEKKWAAMDATERSAFATAARAMCDKHNDIHLHAIIVKKERVAEHIRKDGNKLYNYMIKLALVDRMCAYDVVTMIPDPRSLKVKSGNSLHDYLQTEIWFTKNAKTELKTLPLDSHTCLGIQFADMLAGVVQCAFENNRFDDFNLILPKVKIKRLFF